jgi:glycosyltransferase involved in cell wall biosynthesis
VSVVIPAYRHRDYVLLTLESVFAQTFTDYEVIVVNDGSPDDTADLLRPLAQAGRIRYIEQTNRGQGAARNRGIAEARGEFIALLDDDDLWPPDKLAWQVEALRRHPQVAVVYGKPVCIDASGAVITFEDQERRPLWRLSRAPSGNIYEQIMEESCIVSPGLCLVRRSALATLGEAPFDPHPSIKGCDDWDLWLRLSRRWRFLFVDAVALRYRLHASGASDNSVRMCRSSLALRRKQYLTESDPRLRARWKVLYREALSELATFLVAESKKAGAKGKHPRQIALLLKAIAIDSMFGVNKFRKMLYHRSHRSYSHQLRQLWLAFRREPR